MIIICFQSILLIVNVVFFPLFHFAI